MHNAPFTAWRIIALTEIMRPIPGEVDGANYKHENDLVKYKPDAVHSRLRSSLKASCLRPGKKEKEKKGHVFLEKFLDTFNSRKIVFICII